MATLAANTPRAYDQGGRNHLPIIASDIIYEGAAVGVVEASGYVRPLVGGDRFAGFATAKVDNATGSAGDLNVELMKRGQVQLSVSGAVITDQGQPVYATDDDTFVFSPVGGSFIGFVKRWVEAGVVVVDFDVDAYTDPYGEYSVREAITGAKTLDSGDSGKLFFVTATAVVTLPAVATPALCKVVNGGAYGAVQISLSPQAVDSVEGPDITAADNKDLINTLATANRGDFAVLGDTDADGYIVTELVGTWAREA